METKTDTDEIDLLLSTGDTRPMGLEDTVLNSLPLHPVQRGMPDFELPDLPAAREQKTTQIQMPRAPEPVDFDRLQDFSQDDARHGLSGGDSGGGAFKWVALAALAALLVGGGWFGYRHFAGSSGDEPTPAIAVESVETPAADVSTSVEEVMDTASEAGMAVAPVAIDHAGSMSTSDAVDAAVQAPAPEIRSDQPVPVTVPPVHVLQDSPGSGSVGSAPNSNRRNSRNQSLDSLLD